MIKIETEEFEKEKQCKHRVYHQEKVFRRLRETKNFITLVKEFFWLINTLNWKQPKVKLIMHDDITKMVWCTSKILQQMLQDL